MIQVPLDAPGFRGRDPEVLQQFIRYLNEASYYRAGEGRNYAPALARQAVDDAAALAIEHKFSFWMIDMLVFNAQPLVERGEIVDRIFRKVYDNA